MSDLKLRSLVAVSTMALALGLTACGDSGSDTQEPANTAEMEDTAATEMAEAEESMEETMDDAAEETSEMAEEAETEMAEAGNEMESAAERAGQAVEGAAQNVADNASNMAQDAMNDMAAGGAAADGGAATIQVAGYTGNAEDGQVVFRKCMACHVVQEGMNRVGPSLYKIIGREAGSVEGYNYSQANANSGVTWTPEVMFEYLEDPRGFMPGTKMAFAGLPKPQDRADVIAYLKAESGQID
jgi:cytochrome c